MSEHPRGTITPTGTGGWLIKPGLWREPKAAASPDARLVVGRLVRVSFTMILDEDGKRGAMLEAAVTVANARYRAFMDALGSEAYAAGPRP